MASGILFNFDTDKAEHTIYLKNKTTMIDILNRTALFEHINKLNEDDKPAFGAMSPQHMVEHLAFTVGFSNGNAPQQQRYPAEKEQKIKAFILDNDMPVSFKSPVLPEEGLPTLKQPNLAAAIEQLNIELAHFDQYFALHPSAEPLNPTMGTLKYTEWLRFHNRHFTHHFKQFNLI